ncbi:hypothetical protein [Bdellovibrio sp. HCB337]|uniref:hypothetical protein n=1 Tax=Bdellovibrio sp. HCB337 TaxID=3394358 RepID=UPI0039A47C8B
MRFIILTLTVLLTQQTLASTFVGNGGNAGDIELQMTLGQVQESLYFINRDKDVEGRKLCVCTETFEGRPICDMLKQLNEEQVRFCAQYVEERASEIERILNTKDQVSFSWTHQNIEVQETHSLRGADAVTNPKEMSMTLNQKRFLEMDSDERLFLIGHELFHLTSYQGVTLSDERSIGPFKGADGGRKFINAMAATIVMNAHEYSVFTKYRTAEKRSKSYKQNWLSLSFASITRPNDTTTPYDVENTSGAQLGFRYQFTHELGVLAQYSHFAGDKALMSTIEARETQDILSVGGAYRWLPFSNPLTFAGQSHFVFSGTVDVMKAKYEINDPNIGTTADAASIGYTLSCNYFIPFKSGMWAYAGFGYSSMPYSFNIDNQVTLEYKKAGTTFALGASYGF